MSETCPSVESLRQMLAGDSTEPDALAVERHVGECAGCQANSSGSLPRTSLLAADRADSWKSGRLTSSGSANHRRVSSGSVSRTRPRSVPGRLAMTAFRRRVRPPELPGYEILGELGRGGMGVVYKARRLSLNRLVALKMILGGAHAGTQAEARFRAEAEVVARLQHPNIVLIYHVAEHEGRPFLEMEYVEGGNLADRLRGEPMAPREAAALVESLARAVAVAHQAGIIHRDLKPANILLAGDGTPKVADFGLAKLLDSESGLTQSDAIMGSPSYMAPEQAEGKARELGPAVDLHALGVDPLRDAHRPAPVPGRDRRRDPRPGPLGRAPTPIPPGPAPAPRPRDHHPEVPGEGTDAALRFGPGAGRGPAPLPRRARPSWLAGPRRRTGREVGAAATRDCRASRCWRSGRYCC